MLELSRAVGQRLGTKAAPNLKFTLLECNPSVSVSIFGGLHMVCAQAKLDVIILFVLMIMDPAFPLSPI
jgi:hypothetical protein